MALTVYVNSCIMGILFAAIVMLSLISIEAECGGRNWVGFLAASTTPLEFLLETTIVKDDNYSSWSVTVSL